MPWNNQNGGGGRGPWGQGPQGGGQGPDLEDLLKRGQDRFRRAFPGKGGMGAAGVILLLLVAGAVWYFSTSVYRILPTEEGVVTRFGRYHATLPDGLHFRWPWPVEQVYKTDMTARTVTVGFGSQRGGRPEENDDENLMLTGDENIVDIDFKVLWQVTNPRDFQFNVESPIETVKAVAESAMREVIGRSKLQPILTQDRAEIISAVQVLMQETLNSYGAGITINQVQLERADPPATVIDAFRDVQAANQDQETKINEARAYANDVVPKARGRAEQIRQQAEAYKAQTVAEARGQAARFLAVLEEYKQAKGVTRQRMFLETMEEVFGGMDKVILDENQKSGVVPYLPLTELEWRRTRKPESSTGDQ